MKTFVEAAAQGDVYLRLAEGPSAVPVDLMPAGLKECPAINVELVITHSETGHHHVMVLDREAGAEPNVRMYSGGNPLMAWIKVSRPTALVHRRNFDTHEPELVQPGCYVVRRQREFDPLAKLARQVQD